MVVLGPYITEESANEYAFRHLGSNFETHQLSTRDQSKATRMLKKRLFDKIGDLDQALKRARHQVPKEEGK